MDVHDARTLRVGVETVDEVWGQVAHKAGQHQQVHRPVGIDFRQQAVLGGGPGAKKFPDPILGGIGRKQMLLGKHL
jgi:hypothetical protein